MTQITTTLNRIREHSPCAHGWAKLLKHLDKTKPDDEPLPYSVILESNGLDDALWCCRVEPQHESLWRHFAVDCAESVKHLMTDERSLNALKVARRHADGKVTDDELSAARATAMDASVGLAWSADRDAALGARVAVWVTARAIDWAATRGATSERFRQLVDAGEWTAM